MECGWTTVFYILYHQLGCLVSLGLRESIGSIDRSLVFWVFLREHLSIACLLKWDLIVTSPQLVQQTLEHGRSWPNAESEREKKRQESSSSNYGSSWWEYCTMGLYRLCFLPVLLNLSVQLVCSFLSHQSLEYDDKTEGRTLYLTLEFAFTSQMSLEIKRGWQILLL